MKILVLCTGNSCRSQMAEGWFRHLGGTFVEVHSAGVDPHDVNPRAIAVMAEAGVDISGHTSKHVDRFVNHQFDYVITVCDNAREVCPVFPGAKKTLHHAFDDPSFTLGTEEKIMGEFRRVREEIRVYCRDFLSRIHDGRGR